MSREAEVGEPVLSLQGLSKRFGAIKAVDDVSLDLAYGEIHALIGPNGAGKSTVVKLVSGELRPDAGIIQFDGRRLDGTGQASRARLGLGRTFQVSSIIPGFTVLENVVLAVQGAERKTYRFFARAMSDSEVTGQAIAYIERVELNGRSDVPAAELSHGERRRLELAMALSLRPKAFLLDEPMAGVGPEGAMLMTRLLREIRDDAPILLVEHDMEAVFALANRISVLVYGKVIASGDTAEIRSHRGVREAYLGTDIP